MVKLKKQFEQFDKDIKIDEENEVLRDKRDKLKSDIEEKFPDKCEKYGIDVKKSDLRFIHQGSYKIGTTIKNDGGNIDLDYAMIFPLDTDEHNDPREVKKAVKEALEIKNVREPKIKEPCVTVGYHHGGEEFMHIDFPIYAENNGLLYLARGKEFSGDYKWEIADPEGLNDYFLDCFSDRPQLRRIVRYIKKWKQEKYSASTNSHEVPPSIGLTILACDNFEEFTEDEVDDLSSLYHTMSAIRDMFDVRKNIDDEITYASINCVLPVQPYSDVFYKMRDSSSHMITFYKRLSKAVENLQDACNLSDEHEAAKCVVKVLGNEFSIPEKRAATGASATKRERNYG